MRDAKHGETATQAEAARTWAGRGAWSSAATTGYGGGRREAGVAAASRRPAGRAAVWLSALAILSLAAHPGCLSREDGDRGEERAGASSGRVGSAPASDAAAAGPRAAAPSPEGGPGWLIAYNVLHDEEADDWEVFVMEPDGSGKRNITSHPAVDWAYTDHDGRLALVSDRDDERRKLHLYEMGADGSDIRMITEFRVRDSWLDLRADGSAMVIASEKDGTPDLYIIDRQGNEIRRLTDDEVYDNDPIFSPDGSRVVWRSRRSGTDELWLMDLETGATRQLTHFPGDDPAAGEHAYHAGPPRWVPGKDLISFCSKRGGRYSIYTIHSDGTGLERLPLGENDRIYHDWSPDGRYLAFDGTDGQENYDVYIRDMETGEMRRLTDDPTYEQGPVFVRAASGRPASR